MRSKKPGSGHGKKKYNRRRSSTAPVLVSLLFILGIAFGAAWVWQGMQESALAAGLCGEESGSSVLAAESRTEREAQSLAGADEPVAAAPKAVSNEAPAASAASSASAAEDLDEPGEGESEAGEPPLERPQFSYALPEGERVPTSYFDDAIFFGDSISTGIPAYNVMPNAKVVAFTGINTTNAATKECIDTESGRVTMLEAAKEFGDKKKVYIMLGGNGLGYDKETFIKGYREFLVAVKEQYPDAVIYLQTMTPVTDYAKDTYPSVSNEIIEEYNLEIQELARSEKVYFLDVAGALMDENGKLPDEASPVDGMHFTPEYYAKWFSYLRTHAVKVKE